MTPRDAAIKLLDEWQGKPFEWRVRDCAAMVRKMREYVGKPIDLDLPQYASEKSALRALKKVGYDSLEAACDALLGEALETPLFANEGDIMLAPADGAWDGALAVKVSAERVLLAWGEPLVFEPTGFVDPKTGKAMTTKAWRLF